MATDKKSTKGTGAKPGGAGNKKMTASAGNRGTKTGGTGAKPGGGAGRGGARGK